MSQNNRIVQSFQARVIRPWMIKHYEKTNYGKKIYNYKNVYKGRRCFFIGNGPSLKTKDLSVLHEMGEITFAFNRIYKIFEETPWRPTFYISQDEKMLSRSVEEVDSLNLPVKFIPIQLHWYHNIDIHDAIYFNMNWQQIDNAFNQFDYLFSEDAAHVVYCASTGMYTAAQLALYMGISEIYFIGVDHRFRISQNIRGEIIVDNSVRDYFTDKYNTDKEKLYIPNTEKSTWTYVAMKKYCDQYNCKVYNASRESHLDVFPKVNFDDLF